MSNKTTSNNADEQAALFESWLDGEPLDEALSKDEEWMARVQSASYIQHQSEGGMDVDVPNWDRGGAFVSNKLSWWQWNKLPAISMCFSIFAMSLVLMKVDVSWQSDGMLISFGGHQPQVNQQVIDQLVDTKLKEFAAEQQVVLAHYASDINQKQQDNNLQLATYVLGESRQERKEDMSEFIRYINDQRKDEKLDQKIKLQRIEHELNKAQSFMKNTVYKVKPDSNGYFESKTLNSGE